MSLKYTPAFLVAVQTFVDRVQDQYEKYWKDQGYTFSPAPVITIDPKGQRYLRLVVNNHTQRSVFAFIVTTNGDILKAASWKAPAKHARGSVFSSENGMEAVTAGMPFIRYLNGV